MSTRHVRRTWTLTDSGRKPVESPAPGKFGGHRRTRIFGRLDCPAALRAIARGGYVKNRVFFRDAATACAAGYRPCAVCMPREYASWKTRRATRTSARRSLKPRRAG